MKGLGNGVDEWEDIGERRVADDGVSVVSRKVIWGREFSGERLLVLGAGT